MGEFCSILRCQHFLLAIFCLLAVSKKIVDGNDACRGLGEYCQNHWDCCSQSCLSFAYKCVGISKPKPQNSILSINSRFSEEPMQATYNEILEMAFGNNSETEATPSSLNSRIDVSNHEQPVTEPAPKKVEDAAKDQSACKEIGLKCYSNDECCSKRCHGFLHQCVT